MPVFYELASSVKKWLTAKGALEPLLPLLAERLGDANVVSLVVQSMQ